MGNSIIKGTCRLANESFGWEQNESLGPRYDDVTYNVLNELELKEKSDTKIILAENFRSRKGVIDSINYIFEQIMSKTIGDCAYEDIETLNLEIAQKNFINQ